jgi:hypothetical protein
LNNLTEPKPLPIDVHEALQAICTTGKGRCWYCDVKLPRAKRAIRAGWDVQRIDEHPVASIILVCPKCGERVTQEKSKALSVKAKETVSSSPRLAPDFLAVKAEG